LKKRDFRFFEQWARENKMKPVVRVVEDGGDILIADSGEPFFGENEEGLLGRWYKAGFAIDRGDKTWVASTNYYSATEYDLVSKREGQQHRVNDCLAYARVALKATLEVGLYGPES
jgi:hypothetical protein